MSQTIGFDADQDCSDVAADAYQKGARFVCRYLKNLHHDEATALSDAGLKIISIWEQAAERALGGHVAGEVDGRRAAQMAFALGQPRTSAIVATVDFDPRLFEEAAIAAYLTAFLRSISPHYVLMVYGSGAICTLGINHCGAKYAWLAGARAMRDSVAFFRSGKAAIVQGVGDKRPFTPLKGFDPWVPLNLGIEIDSDIATVDDYGGWTLSANVGETA